MGEQKANMNTAAELRKQVESALAERIPAALSMRSVASPELVSCGVAEVDAMLGGGFPQSAITELTGMDSSGRTTLALSTVAEITQRGESCAYVDVSDSLDPLSAAALGVDLRRLLWVRAGGADAEAATATPAVSRKQNAQSGILQSEVTRKQASRNPVVQEKPPARNGGGWCHPRSETLGLDRAISELFHGPLHNSSGELQDFTPRCSESIRRPRPEPVTFHPEPELNFNSCANAPGKSQKPWSRLDQSLRAVDLLLNTGGFRAVVLDMGDIDPAHARRVPLATWYRFRLQAEKSQTLLLLLTRAACAHSCAAVSLCCEGMKANWHQASYGSPTLLTGLSYCVRVTRQRAAETYRKKPVVSVRNLHHLQPSQAIWSSTTSWSR
jgi:hypothetical protein